jgi:hypothetical protein
MRAWHADALADRPPVVADAAMEIFHSGWEFTITGPGSTEGTTNQVGNFNGHVYPIGLDPVRVVVRGPRCVGTQPD